MAGNLYRRRDWNSALREGTVGRIERVTGSAFCEVGRCDGVAVWRIGCGTRSVKFCAKHTLATMRNRKIWSKP
jgi:hypothetical protein